MSRVRTWKKPNGSCGHRLTGRYTGVWCSHLVYLSHPDPFGPILEGMRAATKNNYYIVEGAVGENVIRKGSLYRLTKQKKIPKFINLRKRYPSQSTVDKISQQQLTANQVVRAQLAVSDLDTVPKIIKKFGIPCDKVHLLVCRCNISKVKERMKMYLLKEAGEQIFGTKRKARL